MAHLNLKSVLPESMGRTRTLVCATLITILLWDSSAMAINALVSQDIPLLTQIAATELASHGELVSILAQASAMLASLKESTTLAKTAWGALNELRHLSPSQLRDAALLGMRNAFPQIDGMYKDIRDISDLNYRDYRAFATLRGMLWEEVYGPAMDYMHNGAETLETITTMEEHRYRSQAKLEGRRAETEQWKKDCEQTSADGKGAGACQGAAQLSAIQTALLLSDIQETNLLILNAEENGLKRAERQEADTIYAYDRWIFDLNNYLGATQEKSRTCIAGRCLYDKYGTKMAARIREFRANHPPPTQPRFVIPMDGEH